jgi:hypothetical protein
VGAVDVAHPPLITDTKDGVTHDTEVIMQHANPLEDSSETKKRRRQSMSIGSGPGAIMFEPGAQTRIRRAPVRAIASVTIDGGPREIFGQVLNISPGGCLLRTEATLEVGSLVEMGITVLGGDFRANVDVEGVIRRHDTSTDRPAYGVEFLAVDATEKESLQWLYGQAMR